MTRGVGFNPSSGAAFINCVLFAGHLPVFGYGRYYEEKIAESERRVRKEAKLIHFCFMPMQAKLVAVPKISHFETEQAINVDESQRVAAIHRKRRITFSKGPTVLAILFFLGSATKRNLEFRPAK
jgi:hypothetical protein